MGMVKREGLRKCSAVTFCRKKSTSHARPHMFRNSGGQKVEDGLASKEVRQIGGRRRQISCRQLLRFGTMNLIKETQSYAVFLKLW